MRAVHIQLSTFLPVLLLAFPLPLPRQQERLTVGGPGAHCPSSSGLSSELFIIDWPTLKQCLQQPHVEKIANVDSTLRTLSVVICGAVFRWVCQRLYFAPVPGSASHHPQPTSGPRLGFRRNVQRGEADPGSSPVDDRDTLQSSTYSTKQCQSEGGVLDHMEHQFKHL